MRQSKLTRSDRERIMDLMAIRALALEGRRRQYGKSRRWLYRLQFGV